MECARAPGGTASVYHHHYKSQLRYRLQPQRPAKTLGHKERLRACVDKFYDWIFLGWIEIRWLPDQSIEVGRAIRGLPLKWLGELPPCLCEFAAICFFQPAHFGAIFCAPQHGLPG